MQTLTNKVPLTIAMLLEAVALLTRRAEREGRHLEAVAAEQLADSLFSEIDWDAVEGIRRGMADAAAGREIPFERLVEEMRSVRSQKE